MNDGAGTDWEGDECSIHFKANWYPYIHRKIGRKPGRTLDKTARSPTGM